MFQNIIAVIIFIGLIFYLLGSTDSKKATEVLSNDGYVNVEITGKNIFSCGDSDYYRTGFTAIKNGKEIHGTVCSGIFFKGNTIRLD